jgi:hypothetical protein
MATQSKLDPSAVLSQGLELLKTWLPQNWELLISREPRDSARQMADAILNLRSSNMITPRIFVEAYQAFAPRDASRVLGGKTDVFRELSGSAPVMVMAPWLSERSRDLLTKAGINYLDLAGNARLEISGMPGLFIERVPRAQQGKTRRSNVILRGRKAGRVIRLLADVAPPYSVFDLAAAAEITPGYVSKILESLESQALIERGTRGVVTNVDWSALLQFRATTYSIFETNPATFYIAADGPAYARDKLRNLVIGRQVPGDSLTLTGSFAAQDFVRVAAPNLLALYVQDDPSQLVALLSLLPADQGANTVLLRSYDESLLKRARSKELPSWLPSNIKKVACAQLALDCLTGTGRMPAEGAAMLEWMAKNVDSWRYPRLSAHPPWA